MHCRELVEVAAMVAAHGPVLIEGSARISGSALVQYWTASKCRLDRWVRSLKKFATDSSHEPDNLAPLWAEVRPVLEEILVAEVGVRVWTAVLYAYDRRRQTVDAEPIARSVLVGHLEVRQRALALLIHSPHIAAEDAVRLNRVRRRAERWTDLLLGHLTQNYPSSELAFEPDRCLEFSSELRQEKHQAASTQAWRLTLASLRVAFQTGLADRTPNADMNRDIADSILACFPAELFDATGTMHSLWIARLSHAADDAQGMIDELLDLNPAEHRRTAGNLLEGARRRRRGPTTG